MGLLEVIMIYFKLQLSLYESMKQKYLSALGDSLSLYQKEASRILMGCSLI
jgi:hypothetical protein